MMKNIGKMFLFVCVTLFVSCTSQENVLLEISSTSMTYQNSEPSVTDIKEAEEYVRAHDKLFGNVLFFASMQDVESLTQKILEMPLKELPVFYKSLNYYSPIIESHILYNNLFEQYSLRYGIENTETSWEKYPDLYDILKEDIINHYRNIIPVKTAYSEELKTEVTTIEPIGELGVKALTNEKNIFVVANYVHKYEGGYYIIIPLKTYEKFASMTAEKIAEYIKDANPDNDLIPDIPEVVYYKYDHYRNEPLSRGFENSRVYSSDEKHRYRMDVSFVAHADYSNFYDYTKCYTELTIKNYKLGGCNLVYWLTRFPTDAQCKYKYEAYSPATTHDLQIEDQRSFSQIKDNKIVQKYELYTYVFNAFPNPTCGFINYFVSANNGRVSFTRSY